MIRKASLRSQKASASLSTPLLMTPGTTRRLKIRTLSNEESAWKTLRKSAGSNAFVTPTGKIVDNVTVWAKVLLAKAVGYVELGEYGDEERKYH